MKQDSDQRYHNMNIVANAVELVAQSVRHLNSDDLKKTIDGESVTSGVLHEAIAARLQRRLKAHQYRKAQ